MRIVVHGSERRVGALVGDVVVDLNLAASMFLAMSGQTRSAVTDAATQVPPRMDDFIATDRAGIAAAAEALAAIDTSGEPPVFEGRQVTFQVSDTALHPPLCAMSRVFMAMGNYPDHLANIWKRRDGRSGSSLSEVAVKVRAGGCSHFVKHRETVVPDGADIRYPARTAALDFEGEVAVVLASSFRDLREDEFADRVWGMTLVNDWSIRDYANRARDFVYTKNFDTSCTIGPAITVQRADDVQSVPFATTVNGTLRQRGTTADMIFSFAELASYLSRDLTLRAGDLISGGTCAGTGADVPDEELAALAGQRRFLEVGDEVEVSSPVVGTIRNRIAGRDDT